MTGSMRADRKQSGAMYESRFERMARRPGGISEEEALENAQKELAQLKPAVGQFVEAECDKLLAALESAKIDGSERDAKVAVADVCSRLIRDVAGNADFVLVGLVAKSLCELFELLAESDVDYPMAVVECHVDALRLARRPEYRGKQIDQFVPQLVDALASAVECVRTLAARRAGDKAESPPLSPAT
jgi:hypothetical protein